MISFSKYLKKITKGVAVAALAATLGASSYYNPDDTGTSPPRGIMPTRMTLAQLRAAATHAAGQVQRQRVEHWSSNRFGASGTIDAYSVGKNVRVDTTLGGIHEAYGSLRGTNWHQGPNGDVVIESGIHPRTEIDARALQSATASLGVSLLGQVSDPVNAFVVRVNPPGGRLSYVFYDTSTYLVDRIEEARAGSRYIITYDDYRTANGTTTPWHIHTTDVRTQSEGDERLISLSYDTPVSDAELAMPASSSAVTVPAFPAAVPVKMLSDRVIVTVKINNRPVNLQLDSGSATILIDSDVIDALHIPTIGKHTATMAGNYTVARARIPSIAVGATTMHDVAVEVAPFAYNDDTTPVAGLLGFDFLDGVVLHVDYDKGKAELLDPNTFTPPAGAATIPIALDDDVPVVAATIGNATGAHFILDTGADRSALYSTFVDAHPHDVADQGLGTQMRDAWPFETAFRGVGGKVRFHPVQVGPFTFAGQHFAQWLFEATYDAAAFEDEDYDGLIGQDVLRYFDVYFDYGKRVIYMVPNQRYRDRFGP